MTTAATTAAALLEFIAHILQISAHTRLHALALLGISLVDPPPVYTSWFYMH
jgi:hypothetical protein